MKSVTDRGMMSRMDLSFGNAPGQIAVTQYMGDDEVSSVRITIEVRTGNPLGPDTRSLWWYNDGRPVVLL